MRVKEQTTQTLHKRGVKSPGAASLAPPAEEAFGGRPGVEEDIPSLQEFHPAAGARHAHQFSDHRGPVRCRDGQHQEPLVGEVKAAIGKGQAVEQVRLDKAGIGRKYLP